MGTSYFLPRIVGATRAAELMLTGRVFGSEEARQYGVVLDIVDACSLRAAIDVENRTQVTCTASGEMDLAREAFVSRAQPEWTSL